MRSPVFVARVLERVSGRRRPPSASGHALDRSVWSSTQ